MKFKTLPLFLLGIALVIAASSCNTNPPPISPPAPPAATPIPPGATLVPPTLLPTVAATPAIALSPTPDAAVGRVTFTIVFDNYAHDLALETDWGYACLVETEKATVLFDTGADGPMLLRNLAALGKDPATIDVIVISHTHGDHTGGLRALLDTGITPRVYLPEDYPVPFKDTSKSHADLVINATEPIEIFPGIYTTGSIGGNILEQALAVQTEEGWVVVTGCAHPGVVRLVRRAIEATGGEVVLVMGGFHLAQSSLGRVDAIIADLQDLGVQKIAPSHCTGDKARETFAAAFGEGYIPAGVGSVIAIGSSPSASTADKGVSASPAAPLADPFSLISQESLFAFLEDLTAIQPYSGWRNSASQGEAEALDYVTERLEELTYLQDLGLELERQSFRVFMGTELWETRLHLTVGGQEIEVPADGLRGPRDEIPQALRFDSDGALNDAERNPVVVEGPVVPVRSAAEIRALSSTGVEGKIVLLDYAIINRVLVRSTQEAARIASDLLDKGPAGLVLVTQFSADQGGSHGFGIGDVSALNWVRTETSIPILYARLEDLAPAGITSWDDLAQVEAARLTWDADVFSPANSGNLVARIPGDDSSSAAGSAMILGAHIDSPNSPGAMDDGSGSVALLEVARVLDAARVQPPVDLYLAWFGSEELGLYGAAHFVATHQALLDRTLAMLEVDCLSRPLDGLSADLKLIAWSYSRLGDDRLTWPDYLAYAAAGRGVEMLPLGVDYFYAEDLAFGGFDVPHADLIYTNDEAFQATGSWHYAAHVHDPYDTVELAREVGDVLEQMAQVALVAALETGRDNPTLHVTPKPDRRALFVASHTESVLIAPTTFVDFGMTLSWEGFDVDMIPYGQAVTPADLESIDLVVVLPVLDYPSPGGEPDLYDEAWDWEEIAALEAYVAKGGLLALTNSARRLKYYNRMQDPNEDWSDVNALAERFGVSYREGVMRFVMAQTEGEHPLVEGLSSLELIDGNGLPFSLAEGQVLARAGGEPVVGLVDYGGAGGQVLVLTDVGMLGSGWGGPANLAFWQNLARYARSR